MIVAGLRWFCLFQWFHWEDGFFLLGVDLLQWVEVFALVRMGIDRITISGAKFFGMTDIFAASSETSIYLISPTRRPGLEEVHTFFARLRTITRRICRWTSFESNKFTRKFTSSNVLYFRWLTEILMRNNFKLLLIDHHSIPFLNHVRIDLSRFNSRPISNDCRRLKLIFSN